MYRDEYAQKAELANSVGPPIRYTRRERLNQIKKQIEDHLQKVNDAIKVLDSNPNIEDVINKIDAAL